MRKSPIQDSKPTTAACSRWIAYAVLLILIVGALVRMGYFLELRHTPDYASPLLDPKLNNYWARAIVTGEWTPPPPGDDPQIQTTPYGRPPGYVFFLSGIYWLSNLSYAWARLLQFAIGLLNIFLIFRLGRRIYGDIAGLVAAGLAAVYGIFVYFEGELSEPVLVILLGLLLVECLLNWSASRKIVHMVFAGLLLGFFALCRPNVLMLAPVIGAWMLYTQGKANLLPTIKAGLTMAVILFLILMPALFRNYLVAKDFVLVSYYGGVNAYIGNNPRSDGVSAIIPDLTEIAGMNTWDCFKYPQVVRGIARSMGREDIKYSEASRYFYKRAVSFILSDPAAFLTMTLKKTVLFWCPAEVCDSKVVAQEIAAARTLRWLPGFPTAMGLFVLGLFCLALDWRKGSLSPLQRQATLLLLLFCLAYCASVIPFFISGRYRVPIIPFMLIIGGYGTFRAFSGTRQNQVLGLVAIATCIGLAHIQWIPYRAAEDGWHIQRAIAFGNSNASAEAIKEYARALEINPANTLARYNMAQEFRKAGNLREAEDLFRKILSDNPTDAQSQNALGYLLAQSGRHDEAITHYGKALEANPLMLLAMNNLGDSFAATGKYDDALAAYRKVLDSYPERDYEFLNNEGGLLLRRGRYDEALDRFKKSIERNSDYAPAHNNMGLELARRGDTSEARKHYEKALRLDPSLKSAAENLAQLDESTLTPEQRLERLRVKTQSGGTALDLNAYAYELSRQGKNDTALEFYRKALEADPGCTLAMNNLGNLYADTGRLAEAERQYRSALEADPADKFAYYNLGNLAARQDNSQQASDYYRKALEANPSDPNIPNNLGLLEARAGRLETAQTWFTKAIGIDEKYHQARVNLGSILLALGKKDEARAAFDTVLQTQPNNEQALLGLAKCLLAEGKNEDAVKALSKLLEVNPGNTQAKEILQKLTG